jgi:hypothetical protein
MTASFNRWSPDMTHAMMLNFKWKYVSTAEIHCQFIEIHGKDVFNLQNHAKIEARKWDSSDAIEDCKVQIKVFMSLDLSHVSTTVVLIGNCVRNWQSILCQNCDYYFHPDEKLMLPISTLLDWDYPLHCDQLTLIHCLCYLLFVN